MIILLFQDSREIRTTIAVIADTYLLVVPFYVNFYWPVIRMITWPGLLLRSYSVNDVT